MEIGGLTFKYNSKLFCEIVDLVVIFDIIIDMKIINDTDINNLILYAKKNLGVYKLVYKDENRKYFLTIISLLNSVFILVIYILLVYFRVDYFYEKICGFCCLLTCICTLMLLKYIDNKTKCKHLMIQDIRFKLLKEYYNDRNYTIKEIEIINQQLEKRIDKIEKKKITILVVISIMILPIWDIFVQTYFNHFSFFEAIKFLVFLIFSSIIILIIIRFLNKALYLYEENFYIKNNVSIIENLIYLNSYIIQEKEEKSNDG